MRRLLFALVVLATGSPRVASAGGDPTFTRDVAPIVQRHCQECHRAGGGGGPFHLITYDQVYRRRAKILETTRPLVHIDDWDFNWQGFYFYRTPVPLPRAAWIELTAAWDNSAANSRNPNRPPKPVQWGERTVDEMGHAAILYTLDDEKLDPRPR